MIGVEGTSPDYAELCAVGESIVIVIGVTGVTKGVTYDPSLS